jgi:hypothetical protein
MFQTRNPDHLSMNLHRSTPQALAIDAQEHVGCGDGDAFVAIHKWMVDCQAFQQRGRFSHDVVLVTSLRPEQGSLQRARITHTRCAVVTLISTVCMPSTSATVR